MTTTANLYVDQGVDFIVSLDLTTDDGEDFDATTYQFYCDVRKLYSETKKFSASLELIEGDSNTLNLIISSSTTRDIEPGKYTYDILMVRTGSGISKILEGLLFILPTNTVPS
jgi:hypothetical protein